MSNNYEDYGYEDYDDKGAVTRKRILIAVFVIAAIVIIIFLIRSCSNGGGSGKPQKPTAFEYESGLLNAGKSYFENNKDKLPQLMGQCAQVELQTLVDKGLVDPANFVNCNRNTTYVLVCKLESGKLQYTPWLTCTDKNSDSEYAALVDGTENDVIADKTLVNFLFMPQVLKKGEAELGPVEEKWKDEIKYESYKTLSTTTHYRFKEKLYVWDIEYRKYYTPNGDKNTADDVKEYYTSAPKAGYESKSDKTTAYKWYTTEGEKIYYTVNGEKYPWPKSPAAGYTHNEGGTIVEMSAIRQKPILYHYCKVSKNSTSGIFTPTPCGQGNAKELTYEARTFYSCVKSGSSSDSILENEVPSANSECTNFSWETQQQGVTCNDIDTTKYQCQTQKVTFYYWYKLGDGNVKKYYPSGKSTAAEETVYYTEAPVKGAIKDESTKATAYKWYKVSSTAQSDYVASKPSTYASKTDKSKWSDWSNWSTKKVTSSTDKQVETKVKVKLQEIKGTTNDNWVDLGTEFMTEEAMIQLLKDNKYEVATLQDIDLNGELKYKIKLQVRNKKEAAN